MITNNFLPANGSLINFDEAIGFVWDVLNTYSRPLKCSEVHKLLVQGCVQCENQALSTPEAVDFKLRNTDSSRVSFLLKSTSVNVLITLLHAT